MSSTDESRDKLDVPIFRRKRVLAVPPPAAQSLEQCRSVGVARSLRLDERKQCRVIGVLGSEQSEIADGAELQLAALNLEALEGGALCCDRRLQGLGIGLHSVQRVGDVLQGSNNRAAIHRSRLVEGSVGSTFLMQQSAGLED